MVSGLYAAVFMVFKYFLMMHVVKIRQKDQISLGSGGNEELERRIRAHGNFLEIVPFFLILLVIAELSGAPLLFIHGLAAIMIVGRALHALGVLKTNFKARFWGMQLSFGALFAGAGLCFWLAWPVMFSF